MDGEIIKLLHLHAPLRFGGGEVFLSNFYEASGPFFENRTLLFSRSSAFEKKLRKLGNVRFSTFYDRDLKVGSMKEYVVVMFYSLGHLLRFKKNISPYLDSDFVIGHGFPFVVLVPIFHFLGIIPRRMKTVHFQHHRLRRPSKGVFWRFVYGVLLNSFDLIIVDSIPVREDIIVPLSKLSSKIFIIGAGLSFHEARRLAELPPNTEILKSISQLRKGRVVAVYASRFVPYKNHQVFLKILRRLRSRGMEDRFLLILTGDEILGSDFEKTIEAEGFGNEVKFTGSLEHDEVFRAVGGADICLFPSLEEGFGLSVLEALALGVPTLAFRFVIPEELHPFLLMADSEHDFIDLAVRLVTDPAMIAQEKERLLGQEKALRYFDIAGILSRLRDHLVKI